MRWIYVVIAVLACSPREEAPLDEFHRVERQLISAFNESLAIQRAGKLDEVGLAARIETDILPSWRQMRAHVTSASLPDSLREPMRKYLEDRQVAWEAYAAALHAPSDAAARPHYDAYHQKNAEADADARVLGPLLNR